MSQLRRSFSDNAIWLGLNAHHDDETLSTVLVAVGDIEEILDDPRGAVYGATIQYRSGRTCQVKERVEEIAKHLGERRS